MVQHPPWHAPPRRVSAGVVIARVFAFGTLALGTAWLALLAAVGGLAIMWGPPCRFGVGCAGVFWPALRNALLGALAAMAMVAIALPLAWRSVWLALWSLAAVLVAYGTGVWAYRAPW